MLSPISPKRTRRCSPKACPSDTMIGLEPVNEAGDARFDRRRGGESDGGLQRIDVRPAGRHVSRLNWHQHDLRYSPEILLDQMQHLADVHWRIVADVVDAIRGVGGRR